MVNRLLLWWVIVLFTCLTLGIFSYLVIWLRKNKSTEPLRFNTLVIIACLCSFGFATLGVVLIGIDGGVVPACLFTHSACNMASDDTSSILPGMVALVGCFLPGVLPALAWKRRCPECSRLGVLRRVSKVHLETVKRYVEEYDQNHRKTGKLAPVYDKHYEFIYHCSACAADIHTHIVNPHITD